MEQLSGTLIDALSVIITALVGLGVVYIRQYVAARVANEEIKTSLLTTVKVLENSVNSSINALSVDAKKALADGNISDEELKMIEDNAVKHFNEQVSPALQKRLQAHVGDVQGLVVNVIKSQVEKANRVTGVQ